MTPRICRVVLITEDKLLGDAVRNRSTDYANVRILTTLEELKSLINTLVAVVSEDFVAAIQEQAERYFFEPEEEGALYHKEDIRARIQQKLAKELLNVPSRADKRENGTWYISAPRFVTKERQRVFWVSRISVEARAYKYTGAGAPLTLGTIQPEALVLSGDLYSGRFLSPSSIRIESEEADSELYRLSSRSLVGLTTSGSRVLLASGKSIFEVTWSVSVSTNQRFSAPKIEAVEFIETSWE